jgi:tetratricopeptide (TPR) repeat protein
VPPVRTRQALNRVIDLYAAWGRPKQAVVLAGEAIARAPRSAAAWHALGLASYRAGAWQAAVATLEGSPHLDGGNEAPAGFVLAMAHWRLGDREKARQWYDRADRRLGSQPNEEGLRLRAEAARLMGRKLERPGGPAKP